MSVRSLRRILIASCTLVVLTSCATSGTDTPASEDATDSTAQATDTVDASEGGTESATPAATGEAEIDLAAFVAAVNEVAADQAVDDMTIDTAVLKLQSDGKIDPATWAVDTTPAAGAAFKFAPGTDRETPYCITTVGVDPGAALDDPAAPVSDGPQRASYIIGKC